MASSHSIFETSGVRSSEQLPSVQVRVSASANLPSEFGAFQLSVFSNDRDSREHPDKIMQLRAQGIAVTRRVPHEVAPNSHNRFYLETKALRSGHLLGAGIATADQGLDGPG